MMKEDYLWNKTGADAEIERLENALKAFRYQETAPPELPAKIIPFRNENRRADFSDSLSRSAAFACLIVVCLGVWFQFSSEKYRVTSKICRKQSRRRSLKSRLTDFG